MNSNYGPQNSYYGYPNAQLRTGSAAAVRSDAQYAPMPVAPQNSGSGMKMAAGALALLAIGIGAFAVMFGMKHDSGVENTAAQSAPSTVINLPSEINIPSLSSSTPSCTGRREQPRSPRHHAPGPGSGAEPGPSPGARPEPGPGSEPEPGR